MRAIAEGFFAANPMILGPVFGLVLFFVVFVGVAWFVLRSRASEFDRVAAMPLSSSEEKRHG